MRVLKINLKNILAKKELNNACKEKSNLLKKLQRKKVVKTKAVKKAAVKKTPVKKKAVTKKVAHSYKKNRKKKVV